MQNTSIPATSTTRNNSLDTFRLIGAFAVVLLHVGYGNLPSMAENNIRLLGRFAVPFFFMVSGYFFYLNFIKSGDKYFTKTIQRLIGIFLIACLVYLTIKMNKISFSFSLLYEGTSYHLWFLSSMIFGLIVCWYHYSYFKSKYLMIIISVVIIVLSLVSDSYAQVFNIRLDKDFCRYLLSIPYLYSGALIAQSQFRVSKVISISLIVLGISFQIGESELLFRYYGYDQFNHQCLVGTILFSFGMFFLSFNSFSNNTLAELGRKYSLSIYVYHQFVNFFLFKVIKFLFKGYADYVFAFSPLVSFAFTLIILTAIARYFPVLFGLLNGELKLAGKFFKRKEAAAAPGALTGTMS